MTKTFLDPAGSVNWPTRHRLDALSGLVAKSGRHKSVQLPGAFAYSEAGTSVLGYLVRGGDPDLRLYLSLVLATRGVDPEAKDSFRAYYTPRPAAWFARTLGYDDAELDRPASAGTRKVQEAMRRLEIQGLVRREKNPGYVDSLWVNHLAPEPRPPYVTLDLDLWRHGWITVLPKVSLGVYVALRRACAGKEKNEIVLTPRVREGYGMSASTWRRGEEALEAAGLLEVAVTTREDARMPTRLRRAYRLHSELLIETPDAEWAEDRRVELAEGTQL